MFFNCVELQQGVQSKVGMVAWVHWRVESRTKRKRKCWTQFMIACSVISFSSSTGWFQTRHRLYLTEAILQKQNDSSSRKIYHNFTGDFYLSHRKTLLQSSKCGSQKFIEYCQMWQRRIYLKHIHMKLKSKKYHTPPYFKISVDPQHYYKKEGTEGRLPWCLEEAFFGLHQAPLMCKEGAPRKLGAAVFGSIALSSLLFDPSRKM